VYVPAAGLNVGVAAGLTVTILIVYAAVATALFEAQVATAIALIISDDVTEIGPL